MNDHNRPQPREQESIYDDADPGASNIIARLRALDEMRDKLNADAHALGRDIAVPPSEDA